MKNGNLSIVKMLTAAGAEKSLGWHDEQTFPLEIAVEFGHLELVKYFLEEGCNPNRPLSSTEESLLCSAAEKGYYDISSELIDAGVNVNYDNFTDCSPLHSAARKGRVDIMKLLISAGSDINSVCNDKYTVLHTACYSGSMDCVKLILENKDFVRVYDYGCGGFTAIGNAICNYHMHLAKYLIKQGLIAKCRTFSASYPDISFEYCCPFLIASCIAEEKTEMADVLFYTGQYTFKELRLEINLLRPDQITDEAADWIQNVQQEPWSLIQLCKFVINNSLRAHLINQCKKTSKRRLPVVEQWKHNIQALELPRKLEELLTFNDL